MTWQAHRVVFRLRTPMHVGLAKVGNIQRTRPYVVGRAVWGALTMRLTRDATPAGKPATDPQSYGRVGQSVHDDLAFTYFFPALADGSGDFAPQWPWAEASLPFAARFLGSRVSTALSPPNNAAADTTLHEIEHVLPNTRDTGAPVYLVGYIFVRVDGSLVQSWRSALDRLCFGGERGYGYGRVACVSALPVDAVDDRVALFGDDGLVVDVSQDRPQVKFKEKARIVAHANPLTDGELRGQREPLVGRVWNDGDGHSVEYTSFCYVPGSRVSRDSKLSIGRFGIWES